MRKFSVSRLIAPLCCLILCVSVAQADQEPIAANEKTSFEAEKTFKKWPAAKIKETFFTWLKTQPAPEDAIMRQIEDLMVVITDESSEDQALIQFARAMALVNPNAKSLWDVCSIASAEVHQYDDAWLLESKEAPFVADHLKLFYSRWLVRERLYDESLPFLEALKPETVFAPSTLLFYQSVAYHRLLKKEPGLKSVNQLLEETEEMPERYQRVAELLRTDLKGLKEESLDYIARQMEDVERRLDLGRAGKTIQVKEDEVVDALAKLIKKIEEQQKQQGQGSGSGSGQAQGNQSNNPADKSTPAGGGGPGEVEKKNVGDTPGWGNLPPEERAKALQEVSKRFPSHYREIIEQFFRSVDKSGPKPDPNK